MTTELDDIDFEHLIAGRDIDICKLIKEMNEFGVACALYGYARGDIIERRWLEAEPLIMKDPEWAYYYAKYVIRGRWPEAEPYIADSANFAHHYALYILKRRWPEAEPRILKYPQIACYYACNVIKGRWIEAEPIIMKIKVWADEYRRAFKL